MIYTVTFNPSLDYVIQVDDLTLGEVNRTTSEKIYPGGKGNNVSVILSNLGHKSKALGFKAGFTGEQMETMLLENIQRVDLTVKEQADGFQLMMDLGLTVEELSEKTGFAKSTIYHRLNVAKLDGDVLERKQVSMKQLIELERIKSIEKRNEILTNYGDSPDFSYRVRYAAEEEKAEEAKEKIIELIEAAGIPKSKKYKYGWEYGFEELQRIRYRGETAEIPEQIESGEFYITDSSNVIIGKEIVNEEREKTPEEKAREERRKKAKQAEELEKSIRRKAVKIVTEFILSPKELSLSDEERKTLVVYSCGQSDEIS